MAKYDPLGRHLATQSGSAVVMDFEDVEQVLGIKLPPSARKHRAWWSNEREGTHVQGRAWLDAGYEVDQVDFNQQRVSFRRIG